MEILPENPETRGVVGNLIMSWFDKSPVTQIVLGVVLFAVGALGVVTYYRAGIHWALPLVAVTIGPLLVCNGFAALRRRRALLSQIRLVKERAEQLIQQVVQIKSAGGNAVDFLASSGISDFHIRQALLREANRRIHADRTS